MFGPSPDDPRVLGIVENNPRGPHASDLWRIVRPFYELDRRGYNVVTRVGYDAREMLEERPQVLVLPRQISQSRAKTQRFIDNCHAMGCAVVIDWDDTPTLHQRAYTAADWAHVQAGAWEWIELADAVTYTTPRLRDTWRKLAKRSYWLPNLIGLELWQDKRQVTRTGAVTVGLQGGDSHARDWSICGWLWKMLAKRYPNLHFVTVGYAPEYLAAAVPATRYHHFNWAGYAEHPLALRWIDIGLAPLEANEWNRCKSPIKWLEYTLAGAACVLSPTMYLDWISPEMALYAENPEEWLETCCRLVEDAEMRKYLSEKSRREVEQWHTWTDDRCRAWMDVYQAVHREVFGNELHSDNELARSAGRPRQPDPAGYRAERLEVPAALDRRLPSERGQLFYLPSHG